MRILVALFSVFITTNCLAQESEEPEIPVLSLSETASQADFIGVVQVADTDYEYVREKYPTGGTAFLKVMIPYKLTRPAEEYVELYEEGLHDNECYFKNPSVFEEGRRYLVFARLNPDVEDQYLGLPGGCALEVLVNSNNTYALRYPLSGITLSDDVSHLAEPMQFGDNYAVMEDDDLTVSERNELLEGGFLVKQDDGTFRYTHGIDLSSIRKLLGPENLTLDRALRRLTPDEEY